LEKCRKGERQHSEALKTYENMAKLMKLPVNHGEQFISYMINFKELKQDYQRANKKLKGINDKMCRNEDPLIQKLGNYCKKVGKWQSELRTEQKDETAMEKMNKESLDFLLEMYYVNKRKIAKKEIGEKSCCTKES